MSPDWERNSEAQIRILAQRTVVRVGIRGVLDWPQGGERQLGHKGRKGYLRRWRHTSILRLICLKGG
jgi:hypothetical protein